MALESDLSTGNNKLPELIASTGYDKPIAPAGNSDADQPHIDPSILAHLGMYI